jgi:hypothetical protein
MQQAANLLMIRPVNFAFNAETSVNNSFQVASNNLTTHTEALKEFDIFVNQLQFHSVDVLVVEDTKEPSTPDSIFPNNWISFHENGTICLYPMFAQNRRLERKTTVLDSIAKKFLIQKTINLTAYEKECAFLEGTGSMVLDRVNKIAYACISERTDVTLFTQWCTLFNYEPITFDAYDSNNQPIYHTNVMMCIADEYAIICIESIKSETQKNRVITLIEKSNKKLIPISIDQMNHFAGNMLQIKNKMGNKFLVMSTQAFGYLNSEQLSALQEYNPIIHSDIHTIETNGGGSARCMIAEIFLSEI